MVEIRWSLQAVEDVEEIVKYISRDSEHVARLYAKKIFDTVHRLKSFPRMGKIVSEVNSENIRELRLGTYRIIYRITHEIIEVLTVFHSARILDDETLETHF